MRLFPKREKHWLKFLRVISIAVGVIMVWRGIWSLLDLYLFPENPVLSYLLSIFIGLILLYIPDHDIKELIE